MLVRHKFEFLIIFCLLYSILKHCNCHRNTVSILFPYECYVPELVPMHKVAKEYFRVQRKLSCATSQIETSVIKNAINTHAFLMIDKKNRDPLQCCFQSLDRSGNYISPDKCFNIFRTGLTKHSIEKGILHVYCYKKDLKNLGPKKFVYANVHYPQILSKKQSNEHNKTNILLIGIDGMSRLNFLRTMPLTHSFFKAYNFTDFEKFNVVGESHVENLMALFTGVKYTRKQKKAKFVWNMYQDQNFTVKFVEDKVSASLFDGSGISNELILLPDYLLKVPNKYNRLCYGTEPQAKRMLDIVTDIFGTYTENPVFTYAWTSSFSENSINGATAADKLFHTSLQVLSKGNVFKNTIIIFFSPNGNRFEPGFRSTFPGWLEQRLPMLFIYIPPEFQSKFPVEYYNLQENRNKLVTPYDLYVTLQHMLELQTDFVRSPASVYSNSLFTMIPARSCADMSISDQWCSCTQTIKNISMNNTIARRAAKFLVQHINNYISHLKECRTYILDKIHLIKITQNRDRLLIIVKFLPSVIFEAMLDIHYNKGKSGLTFNLSSNTSILRLDNYMENSYCMNNVRLRKYCWCYGKI